MKSKQKCFDFRYFAIVSEIRTKSLCFIHILTKNVSENQTFFVRFWNPSRLESKHMSGWNPYWFGFRPIITISVNDTSHLVILMSLKIILFSCWRKAHLKIISLGIVAQIDGLVYGQVRRRFVVWHLRSQEVVDGVVVGTPAQLVVPCVLAYKCKQIKASVWKPDVRNLELSKNWTR